jgi:hypothetical protein
VSDRILRLVRIWCQLFMDVLDICTVARTTIHSPAVSDMNMSPHRRTDKIAHHWCSLITRGEFTTFQFETRPIRPINGPARLRHGSMAGFMLLLVVTLRYFERQASASSAVFKNPPYQGAKHKNSYNSRTCIVLNITSYEKVKYNHRASQK